MTIVGPTAASFHVKDGSAAAGFMLSPPHWVRSGICSPAEFGSIPTEGTIPSWQTGMRSAVNGDQPSSILGLGAKWSPTDRQRNF